MHWFISHFGTLIAGLLLALAVFVAIRLIYKNKKSGKHSCGGSCEGCAFSDRCHK